MLRIHHFAADKEFANVGEAVEEAGMNWSIKTTAIKDAETDDIIPKMINIKRVEKDETLKTHNLSLGVMTTDYIPVPNDKLFMPFNSFLESKQVRMASMGELKNGKVLFCQGQIIGSEELSVGNDGHDKVAPYLLCYNSHDGSRSFGVSQNQVRVVCQNTLMMAMKRGSLVRYTHKQGILKKVDNVVDIIARVTKEWQDSLDVAAKLRDVKINGTQLEEYVKNFMGVDLKKEIKGRTKDQFNKIMVAAQSSPGNDANDLNLWSAYNGVTYFQTHQQGKADNRVYNNFFGTGAADNFDAWKSAVSMAGLALAA